MLTVYLRWDFICCSIFFLILTIQVEVLGFQTSSVCFELFSIVLPIYACKHKKILTQCLHAWIFRGDLHACYPVLLKSPIGNVRMTVRD